MRIPPLRITVVGPIYGGSLPIAAFVTRALTRLGHSVSYVDNTPFAGAWKALRIFDDSPQQSQVFHAAINEVVQAVSALNVIRSQPDLVLYLAQAPVRSVGLHPLRESGIVTVFWFVEDFHTFGYWKNMAGQFDHFWAIQKGEFESLLRASGQQLVDYVPTACDPDVHRPYSEEECARYTSDVSFAGSGYANRHHVLAALLEHQPRIFGTEWKYNPVLAPFVGHDGELSSVELAKIFSASKISLNICSSVFHDALADKKDFLNPRTFEICASGGFQLLDAAAPVQDFFEPDKEVVTFGSVGEAKDKIRYFLSHETERRTIAQRGHERARKEHTYDLRLQGALQRVLERDEKRILERARTTKRH